MPDSTPNYAFRIPKVDGTDFIVPDDVRVPVTSIDSTIKNESNLRASGDTSNTNALNTYKNGVDASYQNFTCIIKAPGAFSLGNATVYAKYKDYAHTRHCFVEIVRGSTTNIGASDYTFEFQGLPTNQAKAGVLGNGMFFDSSPFKEYPCLVRGVSSDNFVLVLTYNNDRVSYLAPVAPSTGDVYVLDITYEIA